MENLLYSGVWTDIRHDNCSMHSFPHLVTYAKKTVHEADQQDYLEDLFNFLLSQQAYSEFLQMEENCISTTELLDL
jgi:hypothetical protein